jgi:hypothetical protein
LDISSFRQYEEAVLPNVLQNGLSFKKNCSTRAARAIFQEAVVVPNGYLFVMGVNTVPFVSNRDCGFQILQSLAETNMQLYFELGFNSPAVCSDSTTQTILSTTFLFQIT